MRYFEDFEAGQTGRVGPRVITREEIIDYAREFDPQPFHLDDEAGKNSILGGLSASGWHTCSLLMRMIADDLLGDTRSLGGPGVEECRWVRPVRPGDTLHADYVILETRVMRSRPTVGIIRYSFDMQNQNGETVLKWLNPAFVALRAYDMDANSPAVTDEPHGEGGAT